MSGFWGRGSAGEVAEEPPRQGRLESIPSVLWVPDDDLRLLLRGVLALQHHPVVLELTTSEALRRWEAPPVALFIVDAASGADRWREELAAALALRPELRALVLLPRGQESVRGAAESLGARATLARPFAMKDLAEAIRVALRAPAH